MSFHARVAVMVLLGTMVGLLGECLARGRARRPIQRPVIPLAAPSSSVSALRATRPNPGCT